MRAWRGLPRGHDGSPSLCAALWRLGIRLATRLVQRVVKQLKLDRSTRLRQRIERQRVHVEVLARDALWSSDESHLTRDEQGETRALAVRETCVPRTLWLSAGPPVHAEDLVRALELTACERGGWPLVLGLDNGGPNRSDELARVLEREQVIALFNVPHTPEHNAFVERGIGELKQAIGPDGLAARCTDAVQGHVCVLDPGVLATEGGLRASLRDAWLVLDATPRYALGGSTPAEIDSLTERADHVTCRARFYADARAALERVAAQQLDPRARRRAEREAILSTLEAHGLVRRTRGGGRSPRSTKRNAFV